MKARYIGVHQLGRADSVGDVELPYKSEVPGETNLTMTVSTNLDAIMGAVWTKIDRQKALANVSLRVTF